MSDETGDGCGCVVLAAAVVALMFLFLGEPDVFDAAREAAIRWLRS